MKFSTALLAATAVVGTMAVAPDANAILLATVNGAYVPDQGLASVTNNSPVTETNIVLAGIALGSLAPGATSGSVGLGDYDECCGINPIGLTFDAGGKSFSGSFSAPGFMFGDQYGATGTIGTVSGAIPEPATLAIVGSALLGLGAARRRRG